MAFKKSTPDDGFSGDIKEFIAPITESNKHDWVKGVAKIVWGENPETLDIRKMNPSSKKIGAGISLSDEEANTLTNILLDNDYGDFETIAKAFHKKKARFETQDTGNVISMESKKLG